MGEKITKNADNTLNVPESPIVPFIEGDDGLVGYVNFSILDCHFFTLAGDLVGLIGHNSSPSFLQCIFSILLIVNKI